MRGKRYGYDPLDLLSQWQKDLDRIFGQQQAQTDAEEDTSSVATSNWTPPVDIVETDQGFSIYVDVPGIDPKDIEISMEQGVLSIQGERPLENKDVLKSYKRMERVRGTFHRRFSLPDTADAEKISANGKHGVLEISIPKRALAQPRKIKVQAE